MVKLQHERNRGPGEFILVNGTKYELDEEGNIECSEADATRLQSGAKWKPPEYWDARRDKIAAFTPPSAAAGGGRRVRTRDELVATAEASGIPLEEVDPESKAIESTSPEAIAAKAQEKAQADAELTGDETITVSEDMSKSELLALAKDCGITATKAMTKAQIMELFEDEE